MEKTTAVEADEKATIAEVTATIMAEVTTLATLNTAVAMEAEMTAAAKSKAKIQYQKIHCSFLTYPVDFFFSDPSYWN